MKRAVMAVLTLALALTVVGCVLAVKSYKKAPSLPDYGAELKLPGLSDTVKVYRDEWGVPHIFAENERDLFRALGYVHAQDRLWEMVLFRAIATGRLSELFGDVGVPGVEAMGFPLSTTGIDRRQRTLGLKYIGEVGEALAKDTQPEMYADVSAYCEGANHFIRTHDKLAELPVEFQMLRVKPDEFRPANVVSFGRFIGLLLGSNMEIELARHAAIKEFGVERGWELVPLYDAPGPTIVPADLLKNRLDQPRDLPPGGKPSDAELGLVPELSADDAKALLLSSNTFRQVLGFVKGIGSNNWLASPKITESGNAILANDPHLPHMEPSLFYMVHMKGGDIDAYGVTFPGNPYIALGHTKKLSWGATTSRADNQDLFIETVDKEHKGQYLYKGEWRDFVEREEVIKVRGGLNKKLKIRHTVHGPVINDIAAKVDKSAPPIALRWTGWDISRDLRSHELLVSSRSADEFMEKYRALGDRFEMMNIALALDAMMKGESVDDFAAALDKLVLPNQNWIAADSDGHIMYLPAGLLPIRKAGIGALPSAGEGGDFDWTGFVPLMEHPYLKDPDRGWIVTANNEVVDSEWYPYIFCTNGGQPWRAWRIQELIEKMKPLSVDDMVTIQNDIYVRRAEWEVPMILAAVENKGSDDPMVQKAAEELRGWDYEADLDSTETVIFYQFIKDLERNILEDDAEDHKLYHIEGYGDMAINIMLMKGESSFFDDKNTKDVVEDMDDMLVRSLGDAMRAVEKKYGKDPENRRWGKLHWIKWYNFVGVVDKLNVGPYPHTGADQTVRNAAFAGFGKAPYKALVGPTLRHIIDMGDTENAKIMIDGSQSGQWLSPHYDDLHPMFIDSQYIRAMKDPEDIEEKSPHLMTLKP